MQKQRDCVQGNDGATESSLNPTQFTQFPPQRVGTHSFSSHLRLNIPTGSGGPNPSGLPYLRDCRQPCGKPCLRVHPAYYRPKHPCSWLCKRAYREFRTIPFTSNIQPSVHGNGDAERLHHYHRSYPVSVPYADVPTRLLFEQPISAAGGVVRAHAVRHQQQQQQQHPNQRRRRTDHAHDAAGLALPSRRTHPCRSARDGS